MKKTALVVLALALVGIVAAAGCISTETQSPAGDWFIPGTDITLTITPEGSVIGHAPVNSYFGSCTIDGNKISFSLGATMMTNTDEEIAYFEALNSVDSFKAEAGKLVLLSEGKEVLTFSMALIGTFVTEDGISITLNRDMTFSGNGPANSFFGTYAYTENGVQFTLGGTTRALGSEEEMALEAAFFEALGAQTFTFADGKFVLGDFTLTPSVVGNWMTISGITLVLNADGTFAGQAPVNSYFGEYEVADGKVTFKNVGATKMMGDEEEMAAEDAFFKSLEGTFTEGQFLTAEGITFIRA